MVAQQPQPLELLVRAARKGAPGLARQITETLGPHGGTAVWGPEFLFVSESDTPLTISIDGLPPVPMQAVAQSKLWLRLEKMSTGVTHSFQYEKGGQLIGERSDVAGYQADSYPEAGVARGMLSERHTIVSNLYGGIIGFIARRG